MWMAPFAWKGSSSFNVLECVHLRSFQCHLALDPCVLGAAIRVQSTDLQLWPETKHVPVVFSHSCIGRQLLPLLSRTSGHAL